MNFIKLLLAFTFLFSTTAQAFTGTVIQADTVSGSTSETNYWSGGDAEKIITGVRLYNDGAVSRPVDCTGGSVTGLTMRRESFAPLGDKWSWDIDKQSGNKQGMGAAVDFKVDRSISTIANMATVFEYILASGTFTAASGTVDSDLVVALYDRTAGAMVGTTDGRFFTSSNANRADFLQTWVSKLSSTDYTLCFHIATTTTNAFTMKVDSGKIGKNRTMAIPDGASFFGGMEQVGAAGCNYTENTSSSATNFVDLGAGTGCSAWTVTGKVLATGTNDHRPILVTPGPGHYQVVINAGVYGKASGTCVWRLTDGTTTFPAQQQYSNSGQNLIPSLIFNITYSAQQASNMTLKVQAADDQATGCELNNGLTSAAMSWKIYKFPLNGTAYSNVIPASCINNPDCQNNFSAKVSSTGVVTDENYSFINGNGAAGGTGTWTYTFDTSRFSVAPTCVVTAAEPTSSAWRIGSTSTTSITITTQDSAFAGSNRAINIICSRAGTDIKPWGPIPLLSGMTSSNAPGNEKLDTAKLSCATASSKLIDRGNLVTSISNRSADKCTIVVNGYSAEPQCFLMPIDGGSSTIKLRWFSYSHTGTTTTMVSACAFGAADGVCGDQIYNLFCDGPR